MARQGTINGKDYVGQVSPSGNQFVASIVSVGLHYSKFRNSEEEAIKELNSMWGELESKSKLVIDEQEKEEIMRVLMHSLGMRDQARFTIYHQFEDCAVIGVVEKIDPYTRTFIVDGERFKMEDIIGAQLE